MTTHGPQTTGHLNPEVGAWFEKLDHPLLENMLLVRRIILAADDRMTESIKWSAPPFSYRGNLASFQPRAKRFVSLMFHRGSEIPGNHSALEGDAPLVRIMRFQDKADIEAQQAALEAIGQAWCVSRAA